jgi:hypothetical protein
MTMNLEVTEAEVRLIKKLLKKELTHAKTKVRLVKIFDLQNKLNNLTPKQYCVLCKSIEESKEIINFPLDCGSCGKTHTT